MQKVLHVPILDSMGMFGEALLHLLIIGEVILLVLIVWLRQDGEAQTVQETKPMDCTAEDLLSGASPVLVPRVSRPGTEMPIHGCLNSSGIDWVGRACQTQQGLDSQQIGCQYSQRTELVP